MKIVNSSEKAKVTYGSYTGNATVNRAIPHGLGRKPTLVLIMRTTGLFIYRIFSTVAAIIAISSTVNTYKAVTAMDATNFYVGNATEYSHSANGDLQSFVWIAIG